MQTTQGNEFSSLTGFNSSEFIGKSGNNYGFTNFSYKVKVKMFEKIDTILVYSVVVKIFYSFFRREHPGYIWRLLMALARTLFNLRPPPTLNFSIPDQNKRASNLADLCIQYLDQVRRRTKSVDSKWRRNFFHFLYRFE